jgi:hypothetical protein
MPRVDVPIKTIQFLKKGREIQPKDALRKRQRIMRKKIFFNIVNASQPMIDGYRVDHVHP